MTSKTITRAVLPVMLFSALACAKAPEEFPTPPSLTINLEPQLVVGEAPGAQAGLLGAPRDVRTDDAGQIYVADVLAMGVKLFDSQGQYLRTIGDRGQSPDHPIRRRRSDRDVSNPRLRRVDLATSHR